MTRFASLSRMALLIGLFLAVGMSPNPGVPRNADEDINRLIDQATSGNDLQRNHAATALAESGPRGRKGLDVLLDNLGHEQGHVWHASYNALTRLLEPADLPLLRTRLSDPRPRVRGQVAILLREPKLSPRAIEAESELVARLSDADGWARGQMARTLGVLGSTVAINEIAEMLGGYVKQDERYYFLTEDAAAALEALGPKAEAAVPALLGFLENSGGRGAAQHYGFADHNAVIRTLGSIGNPSAIETLENKLPFRQLSGSAAVALARLGSKGSIPKIRKALRGETNFAAQCSIIKALGDLQAQEAIPDLKLALKDTDNFCTPQLPITSCYPVRSCAKKALKKIRTSSGNSNLWWKFWYSLGR